MARKELRVGLIGVGAAAQVNHIPALKRTEGVELVALTDKANTRAEKLSGGQAQRLSIACALIHDPEIRLHSVEALLKERQRAFIELVTTTETLRMKVAHLEEIIEQRDRELTKLRVSRAS